MLAMMGAVGHNHASNHPEKTKRIGRATRGRRCAAVQRQVRHEVAA